jgi:hypothetical protein
VTDGVNGSLRYPAYSFGVTPGYYYEFVMRISWMNDTTGLPMAAAYYYFNQIGDLQCASSRCYLFYASYDPNGPIQNIYSLYLY